MAACSKRPSPTPPSGDSITGRERIGWDQAAADATEVASLGYAVYVNGVRAELTGASCAAAGQGRFSCSAPLPALSAGSHTLELASFVVDGLVVESAKSAPLRVTVGSAAFGAIRVQTELVTNDPLGSSDAAASDGRIVLFAASGSEPSARLVSAPRIVMPGSVDSNVPLAWNRLDGAPRLSAFASWGGVPALLAGASLDSMLRISDVTFAPHPGHGIWIESVIPDESGVWYGYYHHEVPADVCGRPDRSIPRVGAARSLDRGLTWEDFGIVLEAPPDSQACASANRYVIGGVGDVSGMLDRDGQNLFLFFSQYSRDRSMQGVAVARMAWADRDAPVGKMMVSQGGAWIPGSQGSRGWEYPSGTSIVPVSKPWHDADGAVDAFWGPSIHWNTYLERYVMLLNRARNESYNSDGIYVSYADVLDDPRGWSAPQKILNGGEWYPQVAGLEAGSGTDKQAGQRARFFMTGRSAHYIEFQR